MTDETARALAALVAALVCVAGGAAAFGLSLWMRPPPPSNAGEVIDEILPSLNPDDLAPINAALPRDASALVFVRPEPAVDPVSPPPATGEPRDEATGDPQPGSGGPAGSGAQQPGDPGEQGDPADGQGQPPVPPDDTTIASAVWSDRTLIVSDSDDFAVERERLKSTSEVAERSGPDGTVLAVATPRTDRPTRTAPAVAGVAALTGALAALTIVLLWRPGRRRSPPTPPDEPTGRHGPRPPVSDPAPVPVGSPAPERPVGLPPDPRGPAAGPAGGDGSTPHLPLAVATAEPPPPDPLPALRTERATLIRGLADLAAKLPAEYEWQAANVLDAAGIRRIMPDGDVFDPARHHAVDTVPTPDAQLDDTVARTLRAGWADGNQVVLPARVVVYAAPVPERGPDDGRH